MKRAATGVLPALVLGLLVMNAHGAPLALPATNLASFVVGLLVVFVSGKRLAALVAERPVVVAFVVLCLEACTLAAPGIDGVHRWVAWGKLRLHPAAIFDPVLLLAVVVLWLRGRTWTATSLIAAGLALHVAQPDAGQATALAAGALALALLPGPRFGDRLALIAVIAAGPVLAWLRPDPLPPVDFVENIVPMAFELHPLMGAVSVVSLVALPVSALWRSRESATPRDNGLRFGVVLAAYLSANALVVLFGAFPTPVLGFGASPIIGAILGIGLLDLVSLRLSLEPTAQGDA